MVCDGEGKEGSREVVACGWRDVSVVMRTTSSGGPRHSSQHPQQSVCSSPEHPAPSSGFYRHCTHMIDIHADKVLIGIKF